MKSGELLKTFSSALKMPEPTIAVYMRVLREAGFITTGARGVNAPSVTTLDAGRLLIAIMATDKPSRAAEAVKDFGTLRCDAKDIELYDTNKDFTFKKARGLPDDHTLEQAIAALLDIHILDADKPFFSEPAAFGFVVLRRHALDAQISLPGASYRYLDPSWLEPWQATPPPPPSTEDLDEFKKWAAEAEAIFEQQGVSMERSRKYSTSRIRIEAEVRADVIDRIAARFAERSSIYE